MQAGKTVLDARPVCLAGDADIDLGEGVGGDDIGLGAAAGKAYADGESALEVGPGADGLDDFGELAEG